MTDLSSLVRDLVVANRILAREGVVDAYGHVSVRHPGDPQRFLLATSIAPEMVEESHIVEFDIECRPVKDDGRPLYHERFIHGGIYEARPDVHSVVHNHSPSVIPFGVTGGKLKPLLHMCANIGHEVPIWDSHDKFGDTALLVDSVDMGRDLAHAMGAGRTVLMRGHGATVLGPTVRQAVFISIYLEVNAKLQMQAMAMGDIKFLTPGEVDKIMARTGPYSINRAWENWCRRAGRPVTEEG